MSEAVTDAHRLFDHALQLRLVNRNKQALEEASKIGGDRGLGVFDPRFWPHWTKHVVSLKADDVKAVIRSVNSQTNDDLRISEYWNYKHEFIQSTGAFAIEPTSESGVTAPTPCSLLAWHERERLVRDEAVSSGAHSLLPESVLTDLNIYAKIVKGVVHTIAVKKYPKPKPTTPIFYKDDVY